MNTETIILQNKNCKLGKIELNIARNIIRFIDMMKNGIKSSTNKWMQKHYDECIRWTRYEILKDAVSSLDHTCFFDFQNEMSEAFEDDSDDFCYEVPQDILEDSFWAGAEDEQHLDRFIVRKGNDETYYVKK